MKTALEVQGVCDERFGAVRNAFAGNFAAHDEVGASVSVVVDGQTVVDLWGGHMDAARTRPWERDTIVCVWSTTKGVVATCAQRLVDQGLLDLDAPVAKYWPEFAQAGKSEIPVRYLLSHQAGLPAISEPLPPGSLYEWDLMVRALEKQEPWWTPGTKHGYHAFTFGWLVGEVIRRVAGMSVGAYFRKEIAEPLGLDFYIGLGPEHDARTAEMIAAEAPQPGETNFVVEMIRDPQSMSFKVLANPPDLFAPGVVNTREWRAAEIPAANGHGNARSVARLYGALARGGEIEGPDGQAVRVLSPEAIERATIEQARGGDEVMGLNLRIALGFFLTSPDAQLGPNSGAFGHSGAGGSLGFADPDARLGFGYAMNRMIQEDTLTDPRWAPLIDAVYASL
ncbi:MAG TPA: serine hydrolase domain-containing protein [Dehalococcoidia bacterium]|jgi:CubicO group peptidase (beta-lactamase class C family)|nr:serine hydrolase domain-containing protein [Dehalococcoidia bacterium]